MAETIFISDISKGVVKMWNEYDFEFKSFHCPEIADKNATISQSSPLFHNTFTVAQYRNTPGIRATGNHLFNTSPDVLLFGFWRTTSNQLNRITIC